MLAMLFIALVCSIATMAAALITNYTLAFTAAIGMVVFASVAFAMIGPLLLPFKSKWSAYLGGVYILPLVFGMQLGFPGFLLALGYGAFASYAKKVSPKKGHSAVDILYAVAFAALVGYRLIKGF